jgi:class 3 adenylate cyclase/CHAT domain-containing protein/Tfp pilus assembly protein PilF
MTEPTEDKSKEMETSIEEILRQQDALTKELQDRFKKDLTILFTDICGYTHYMETMGDLKGRAMLQKHNDIVFAAIEQHDGKIIKTIGDAVMATFVAPLPGVRAAVDIQEALEAHNQTAEPSDKIKVKIGLNHGSALVDDKDLFGDAVNVAARVQAKAGPDEILVSEDLYKSVCGSDDILCRFHTNAELKGKAEPMPLYRIVWQDEDYQFEEHQVRAEPASAISSQRADLPTFHIEATREGQSLKLSAYEQSRGETSTVRHYEEIAVSMEGINDRCREIVEVLNTANRRGRITRETLSKLRSIGQLFSDELFTAEVKIKLQQTPADHLVISMDDQLVQIPWELLHDGKQFLCQRFAMGRLVRTRQNVSFASKPRHLARPLKMLVLADPKGDLKGAYEEGQRVVGIADKASSLVNASLRSEGITPDYIKEKIRNFDVVHFAGHSDYDADNPGQSGWRLSDGRFKAQDIRKMAGTAAMPALIFANACQSARTEEWGIHDTIQDDIFGLANAFVLAGVKHYIGTFWEILDEPSSLFAEEFYAQLLSGYSVGIAMRNARQVLIQKYGEETIVWGSYLLYGDPSYNYHDQVQMAAPMPVEMKTAAADMGGDAVRTDTEQIVFGTSETVQQAPAKKSPWMAIAAVLVVVIGAGVFFLFGSKPDTTKEQATLELQYAGGRYDEAVATARVIIDKDPSVRGAYLALGNIQLKRGELDGARSAFEQAIAAETGSEQQRAQAYMGLGRIASMNNDGQASLNYYNQATTAAPNYSGGYVAQAMVAERSGDTAGALGLLERAAQLAPNDATVAAMAADLKKKVALANDKDRQARIDALVKDLLAGMNASEKPAETDTWTSKPLTLWIMDVDCTGYTLQEGMSRIMTTGLTEELLDTGRIQIVERALLDKLMEELKLGSSQLADRRTALSLGRIAAARLIVSPKADFGPAETQVSLRMFETETSRVAGAANIAYEENKTPADITASIAQEIKTKIDEKYPIRGRVAGTGAEGITLNIGDSVGVREGQKFKVIGSETVLEVVAAETNSCLTKILGGGQAVETGARVQAV